MGVMGLLQTLGFKSADKPAIEAQYAPAVMDTTYGYGSFNTGSTFGYNGVGIDRNFALQVASVSRCRNLIAGVISSIDLALYKKSTGEKFQTTSKDLIQAAFGPALQTVDTMERRKSTLVSSTMKRKNLFLPCPKICSNWKIK